MSVCADVAQLVEHQLPKLRVASSSLVVRSSYKGFKSTTAKVFRRLKQPTLVADNSQGTALQSAKRSLSRQHVGNVKEGFLSIRQAAVRYDLSERTLRHWCETGKISAMAKPYGKKVVYSVTPSSIESFIQNHFIDSKAKQNKQILIKEHHAYISGWLKAMERGTLTGRSFSFSTIKDYERNLRIFLSQNKEVSPDTLKKALMKIAPVHFSKREHLYKACLCFSRYLVQEGAIKADVSEQIKVLAPKRHLPPKRQTVKEDHLQKLYEGCQSPQDVALVTLLSTTGLRASEACALDISDIDLMECVLTVQCGKGGKRRQVGLTLSAMAALMNQMKSLPTSSKQSPLFINMSGKRITPRGIHSRLERIGKAVGVPVSPHALRRAFVTINANKGRPLQMLQRACGHSDIKTTMSYCRTSEQEVIDAMKGW